jgi:preprotein translocase subunit SecA
MLTLVRKIFGTQNERVLRSIRPLVQRINELEPQFLSLSDEALRAKTVEFRERLAKGEKLDMLLPEAFATTREAAKRVLGQRHYDVQLIGGIVLHNGRIAEMKTGEGKTLVATLAVYLNALEGKGVHVVTVNDYLARRDSAWMGQVYRFLGLTTGVIVHGLTDKERQDAYGSDITYGTNNEFGFDYLRDNMKFRAEDFVQRPLNFCIVDEVDSILIDEARTPLIISGPTEGSTDKYNTIDKIIPNLSPEKHFTIDEKARSAVLTDEGIAKVESLLNVGNLYDPTNIDTLHHVQQAVKAHAIFKRDVDYVVQDGEVVIVDEFTGRIMPGRRWSDGLHQAVEAKEGVTVENENQTLATVTFQNFFRMYKKLAGMTGTADTEATEFKSIYNLDVTVIPTHRPVQRTDRNDLIYKDIATKYAAIIDEIKVCYEKKQPALVGTISIENSELLSNALKKAGIPHKVLNAKQHASEAYIVSQAGRAGAVTIATNMAGRGTDIKLGGDPEMLARNDAEEGTEEYKELLIKHKAACDAEKEIVINAGGLYILGTERHESRRIDNQLRGRSGRQGDPGASRFYLSLEDDLFRIFGGEKIKNLMGGSLDDEAIEHPWLSRAIENAQKKVENHNFDIRKHLLQYDDVMNMQRKVIYGLRKRILETKDQRAEVEEFLDTIADGFAVEFAGKKGQLEEWDFAGLNQASASSLYFPIGVEAKDIEEATEEGLFKAVRKKLSERYEAKRVELGDFIHEVEKMFMLSTIDHRWKEHLLQMDHLREGIGLRGYAQKDPLLEYKKESFFLFQTLQGQVRQEVIAKILTVQLRNEAAEEEIRRYEEEKEREIKLALNQGEKSQPEQGSRGGQTVSRDEEDRIGRNDPCPCGSGKKYKKCHGR